MRYAQRDELGVLVGHFANPQPGYAEEEVPDDHPDIVAWRRRREQEAREARSKDQDIEVRLAVLEARMAALELKLST